MRLSENVQFALFSQSIGLIILMFPLALTLLNNVFVTLFAIVWIVFFVCAFAWIAYFTPRRLSAPRRTNQFYRFESALRLAIDYWRCIPFFGIFWSFDNPPPLLKRIAFRYRRARIHYE